MGNLQLPPGIAPAELQFAIQPIGTPAPERDHRMTDSRMIRYPPVIGNIRRGTWLPDRIRRMRGPPDYTTAFPMRQNPRGPDRWDMPQRDSTSFSVGLLPPGRRHAQNASFGLVRIRPVEGSGGIREPRVDMNIADAHYHYGVDSVADQYIAGPISPALTYSIAIPAAHAIVEGIPIVRRSAASRLMFVQDYCDDESMSDEHSNAGTREADRFDQLDEAIAANDGDTWSLGPVSLTTDPFMLHEHDLHLLDATRVLPSTLAVGNL